jgi:Flp pilus assembly protein TadG
MTRRSARREEGQAIVLVAMAVVVLLGAAALVLDVGQWYVAKQQAQNAADLAALAAAADLPGDPADADADARAHVLANMPGAAATVTTPYKADAGAVRVDVDVATSFARLLGKNTVSVDAHASARRAGSSIPSAVFAYNASCNVAAGCSSTATTWRSRAASTATA